MLLCRSRGLRRSARVYEWLEVKQENLVWEDVEGQALFLWWCLGMSANAQEQVVPLVGLGDLVLLRKRHSGRDSCLWFQGGISNGTDLSYLEVRSWLHARFPVSSLRSWCFIVCLGGAPNLRQKETARACFCRKICCKSIRLCVEVSTCILIRLNCERLGLVTLPLTKPWSVRSLCCNCQVFCTIGTYRVINRHLNKPLHCISCLWGNSI